MRPRECGKADFVQDRSNTNRFAAQRHSPPTLGEVGRTRPPRGNGAPSRCQSHKERILALLKERGSAGVLSSELYDSPELYGRSPRNRISELRKPDGCLIETIPVDSSTVRYVLLRDSNGEQPNQNPPRTESRDWYEREHGTRPSAHPWKKPFSEKRLTEPDCFVLTPPEPRS